ncbi:MAG: glycosyltransferase family 4 protein [bacterium]|nr:glycosyltransferase family 4 protein [bacterium]
MRITVVTSLYPSPPRPHEGIFAERRWRGMRARGHTVEVVHPQPRTPGPFARGAWGEIAAMPASEERSGIPVVRPRYWHVPRRARANARRFARAALAHVAAPDVVVCDYAWPASAIAPALAERGVPCVVGGRGSDVLQVAGEAGLAEELAHNLVSAGHWCAVSQDLVDAMDRLGGRAGHGVLVPNGVALELFEVSGRSEARERLGLDARGQIVLVVGHLIPRKDPLLALAAFAAGAPPDARLVFIGRGELEDELCAAIEARGLAGRVTLAGEREPGELADWYAACDLLLLTSSREGRPNVVLEALACGRAVLATEAGGTAEIVGQGAMLARDRSPQAIGAQLADLLRAPQDPVELRAMVAALSWDNSLAALERCLEGACAARGGSGGNGADA